MIVVTRQHPSLCAQREMHFTLFEFANKMEMISHHNTLYAHVHIITEGYISYSVVNVLHSQLTGTQ